MSPVAARGRSSGAPGAAAAQTRVLFLLPTLEGGGAERTVLTLIPHLQARGLDARVGLLARGGALDDAIDPAWVVLTRLAPGWMSYPQIPGRAHLVAAVPLVPLQQLDLLLRFRPHVVVSCTASMNLAALLSTRAYGRRRVAWILREGNNTRAMLESDMRGRLGRTVRRWATRLAYRAPDRVVTISNGVAEGLARDFGVSRERVRVLHNPIEVSRIRRLAHDGNGTRFPSRFIVACGRLHPQKGFDLLLRAFAAQRDPDLAAVILGEGPERSRLESLARELGIGARLIMPGFVPNPWAWIAHASAFVLSSRWEGFGSILVEAMACGVPVVAADCNYGPREIVRDGETGLLARAGDAESLAAAVRRVLTTPALRDRLAAGGRRRAMDFEALPIADRYADLMREAAALVHPGARGERAGDHAGRTGL